MTPLTREIGEDFPEIRDAERALRRDVDEKQHDRPECATDSSKPPEK